MNVTEKVAKFKKDLKNNNPKKFNVWAFIFGSFYFFYTGISVWYFFLFFVFPWIFTAALLPVYNNLGVLAVLGLVISHTWAGLVANPEGKRYKEDFIKRFKYARLNADVQYFNISPLRLWLSSFFTLGLYDIYWSYRNWSAYKKATKDDVEPLLMALLNCLTIFSLQSKVQRLLPKRKIINDICAVLYSLLFIFAVLAYGFSISFLSLLMMITYAILPLLLIPIQRSINSLAEKTTNKYSKTEVALLAIGIYWFVSCLFSTAPIEYRLGSLNGQQQEDVGEVVAFVYRHEQGYTKICAAEGYELKKYPNDFHNFFGEDIVKFEKFLKSHNLSVKEIADAAMPEELKTKILLHVYDELKALRRVIILNITAEMQGLQPEEVVWKDELEEAIPMSAVCNIFDIGGVDLLQNSSVKNIFEGKNF